MTAPAFSAILVAAGRSSRMGFDKLWVDLWGRPAWRWALDALLATPGAQRVAVTVPADALDRFAAGLPPEAADRCLVVPGGDGRADSVIAGIWALARSGDDDRTLVLVHDAARPAVTPELIGRVAAAASVGDVGVVPVVEVVDSLKRIRGDRVVAAVEREELAAAQTPQAARLEALRSAIEEAHAWGRPITDDAGALAAAGTPVFVVPGDPLNLKLTAPEDLELVRATLARSASPLDPPSADALVRGARAGIGFDAHRLVPGRPMRIAGVTFPDEPLGPAGHSDGDAALHALVDALLGAAGLGDVGRLFPTDDDAWAGADSAELVRRTVERLANAGWRATGADLAVAVARPSIAARRGETVSSVAEMLRVPQACVSIKGTTTDGLGVAGSGGIAAWAVATVERSA